MTETVVCIQNAQFPDQYSLILLFVLTVAISFSAVMMLITDLDRPMNSMFDMSSQSLVILSKNMDEMLESE